MKRTENVQMKKFGALRKQSNGISLHFPVTKTTQANFIVILHAKIEDPADPFVILLVLADAFPIFTQKILC